MFTLILVACSVPSTDSGSSAIDTAEAADTVDTVADDSEGSCYTMQDSYGDDIDHCFITRPYISVQNETMVKVYSGDSVSWNITFSSAPEEDVLWVNPFVFSMSLHDESGSGWTEDQGWSVSISENNGTTHGAVVEYSNPGVKVMQVGNGSQGGCAVSNISSAEPVVMTITLDISALDLSGGDTIGLTVSDTQEWKSETDGVWETLFGAMLGTTFYFP